MQNKGMKVLDTNVRRCTYLWESDCVSCVVCKASDSEHEIVMTNKKDFMGRTEKLRQIAARLENIELEVRLI